MAALPSWGALSAARLPWNAPIGVRAMPTMTMGSSAAVVMSLLAFFRVKLALRLA
jgi:hypothetical protein